MQLEIPMILESGDIAERYKPCGNTPDIPGLDASLCRCSVCLSRASLGIWWVDMPMRKALLSRSQWNRKPKPEDAIPSSVKVLNKQLAKEAAK